MAQPLRFSRAQREAIEARATAWLEAKVDLPDDYLAFALGNSRAKRVSSTDPELTQRALLKETENNSLRFLVDNLATPAKPEFKPLEENLLKVNFELKPDPKASRPSATGRGSPTRSTMRAPAPVVDERPKKRARGPSSEQSDDDSSALARENYQQSRLKQVLKDTVDRLMRLNVPRSFRGMGFPYDNPFAVRLERNGNVVPEEYFDKVTNPCDLSKVEDQVNMGLYKTLDAFEKDIRLIISNARLYHTVKSLPMYKATTSFERHAARALKEARLKLSR